MGRAERLGSRAERTRGAILEAAEGLFAERGFATTRLEDVAARVGIRRASIVYYFKDKRELYEAVLESVFAALLRQIEAALSSADPLPQRVEAGVSAWVDFVGSRPSFARILLREVADAGPERASALLRHTQPFTELIRKQVFERSAAEDQQLAPVDPLHIASTIAGATVFYVAAMPILVPEVGADLLSPQQLEAHRTQVLRIVRRLLGTRGPRPTRAHSSAPRRETP